MSNISPDTAARAAEDLLLGLFQVLNELVDPEAASRLLAVPPTEIEDWLKDGVEDRARSALQLASLPRNAASLAEYAWGGHFPGSEGDLDEVIHEALVALPLLQGGEGELVNAVGDGLVSEETRGILTKTVDAAVARRTLDSRAYGDLTVPMLAALAGVSEKTIRMAANPKNPEALRTTKVGNSTFVLSDDALDWLRRRGGFQETIYNFSSNSTPPIKGPESLARALTTLRSRRAMAAADVANALGWNSEKVGAYEQLEKGQLIASRIPFSPDDLVALGQLMKVDQPASFAKHAYRAMVSAFAESMTSHLDDAVE
jgi:hypothetical protein